MSIKKLYSSKILVLIVLIISILLIINKYILEKYPRLYQDTFNLMELNRSAESFEMASFYLKDGYYQDINKSIDLLYKLEKENKGRAYSGLCQIYYKHYNDVKKNYNGMDYCYRAMSENYLKSFIITSYIYKDGIGVLQDADKAFELMEKAAKNGNADAQYDLAEMYQESYSSYSNRLPKKYRNAEIINDNLFRYGQPKDIMSYVWFNISAADGYIYSKVQRDTMSRYMPKPNLKLAQKISKDFYRLYAKSPN